jgi:hypothetical protein
MPGVAAGINSFQVSQRRNQTREMTLFIPSMDAIDAVDADSTWPGADANATSSLILRPMAKNGSRESRTKWKVPTILMTVLASVLAAGFLILGAWYLNRRLKVWKRRRQEMSQFGRIEDVENR